MPEVTPEKLEKIIRQVRALLARADHANTPPAEADACRAKAEEFMNQYRVEESHLSERGGVYAIVPVRRVMPICPMDSEFWPAYRTMAAYIMSHVGAKAVWRSQPDDDGVWTYTFDMIGYDSDLRYAESLYQSARLVFADRMEPRLDPNLSDDENVYRMRKAGMERIRITQIFGRKGTGWVTPAYVRACNERGEEPILVGRGLDVKSYREAYAAGFLEEFWDRLYRAKDASDGGSVALVLHDRGEKVQEAYYTAFPHLRPDPTAVVPTTTKVDRRRKAWTKADEKRMERQNSDVARNGRNVGRKAAQEVAIHSDINRPIDK
jgi:hypothetical protein